MNNKNWSDAYDNTKAVGGSERYFSEWQTLAQSFRSTCEREKRARLSVSYGDSERQYYDFFLPHEETRGIVVFVHGGYWMRLRPEYFSHLADGATSRGWAMAMPAYDLCPDVGISDISQQIASAIAKASIEPEVMDKPIILAGHSAGGHLVTRAVSGSVKGGNDIDKQQEIFSSEKKDDGHRINNENKNAEPLDWLLEETLYQRIQHVVSISGIHDLRPLLKTHMNQTLALDTGSCNAQSPALLIPRRSTRLTCWVGNEELPELKRQSALLASIWQGFDCDTRALSEPAKNHFDVIDALAQKSSPLMNCLLE